MKKKKSWRGELKGGREMKRGRNLKSEKDFLVIVKTCAKDHHLIGKS